MIIVDTALKKRAEQNNPVRVAMVGAGFMGHGIALQMFSAFPGMRLVAISNRNIDKARSAYAKAGVQDVEAVENVAQLERAIERGRFAIAEDGLLLCRARGIDAVLEVTGAVEYSARIAFEAIQNGK